MESHIEAIRTAMQPEAAESAKQEGIRACRAILATLEGGAAKQQAAPEASSEPATAPASIGATAPPSAEPTSRQPGGPTAGAAASPAPEPAPHQPGGPSLNTTASPELSALLQSLRGMPAEQLLDLAIARLRAALPPGSTVPATSPIRFQLIPLHHLERSK